MELKALSAACKRGYDTTARSVKRLYERYYAWKHRPPTLEETRQAHNHLRVVQAFIDQHWKTPDTKRSYRDFLTRISLLAEASTALRRATRLDPNITADVTAHDGVVDRWTVDGYAAHLLYIEALLHRAEAERLKEEEYLNTMQPYEGPMTSGRQFKDDIAMSKGRARYAKEKQQKAWLKCCGAISKALKYRPKDVRFLNLLAETYWNTDRTGHRARQTLELSLKEDPDNIDTLKLKHEWRRRLL